MTRAISAAYQSAIAAQVVRPILFVSMEFLSVSTLFLNSTSINVTWSSQIWLGNGLLYGVEGLQETEEISAFGWRVKLSGEDSSLISLILASGNQGQIGRVYIGALDSTETLIVDPELVAKGYFDYAQIEDTGKEASITVNYETDLQAMKRLQDFRYTHYSQQALFPGDKGFEYASAAEDWSGFWGKSHRAPRVARKRRVAAV